MLNSKMNSFPAPIFVGVVSALVVALLCVAAVAAWLYRQARICRGQEPAPPMELQIISVRTRCRGDAADNYLQAQ